jgi:hypothetical protein
MKGYTCAQIEELIKKYTSLGGIVTEADEGVLGYGTLILHSLKRYKSIVVKEFYENSQSSLHSVRQYNKLPKKYQKIIDNS